MLSSVCGGPKRVHFEGSWSLKGHLCILGSLSRAQGPFFTTGLLFGLFLCTFSKVIWVLWGSTKLSFKIEGVTFSNLRRRNSWWNRRQRSWAENQPASEQHLPGWSDLDLAELYIIFNEHVNTRGRRPPHPLPSCKPARGRRGGQNTWQVKPGGLEETRVFLARFGKKTLSYQL